MKIQYLLSNKFTLLVFFILLTSKAFSQEESSGSEKERNFEITTSGVYSYSVEDKEGIGAIEIHPCYWLDNSRIGVGLAYAMKFTDETILSDLSLLGSYEAAKWATINTGASFGFPNGTAREELTIGFYFEVEWNYEINERFHIGILTGTVVGSETELTTGLQMGIKI